MVYVSGSEYEMGYQYGRQVAKYITLVKDGLWSALLERYDRSLILEKLAAYDRCLKQWLTKVKYWEILEGIADGAQDSGYNVTYWDVLLINYQVEFEWLPLPVSCSNIAVWGSATSDGKTIAGSNFDYPFGRGYSYIVIVIAYPNGGNAFVSFGIAGRLGDNFQMNDKGLVHESNKGPNARREDVDYGITDFILGPYIAMTCSTADEAKDVILSVPASNGINHLIVDVRGNAYVIEATASLKAVRRPGAFGEKDYIIAINHFINSTMMPSQVPWDPKLYYPSSWFRYLTAERYIKDFYGKLNVQTIMDIMSSTDYWNGSAWIRNAGWTGNTINRFGLTSATLHSKVAVPADGVLYVCAGNPKYPEWGRLSPGQTGQYVKVYLKDGPLATTKALCDEALRELFSAAQAVEKLSPSNDWSRVLLNNMFDEAKALYWEGMRKMALAELSDEKVEALKLYGEASMSFARAQELCKYLKGLMAFSATELTLKSVLETLNAKIMSIEGDVATIKTDVGTLKVDVAAIRPVVTEIKDGVAIIQTNVGVIKGRVEAVDGNVATIRTDVGTIKADISGVKGAAEAAQLAANAMTIPIYAAVILALIAAVASIYSIMQRRKTAG
ncbi:MAG: C45 family autoproteolytic acyltransferase/hydrolase [Candidatus Nezhaarchaeota archaeon]|nr:C45 family autoproteolytic acyltransferase/hydrolase [Candidatus Nezhaarchaeota archaeon]